MQASWNALYYDGKTAAREVVTVTLAPGALVVHRSGGAELRWPIAELQQTQGRLPGERLRIDFGDEDVTQSVVMSETSLADELRRVSPRANPTRRITQARLRIIAWFSGAIGVGVAAYVWIAPALADWTAQRLPVSVELALGRNVSAGLATVTQCRDKETLAALDAVLERLVPTSQRGGYDYRVVIARNPTVNAFAAPGGMIVVNSGLLSATKTPEELAGVLAHEVQHVMHRHTTRAILREMPLRLTLSLLSNGGSDAVMSSVASLGSLHYQRGDEAQADEDGLRLLQASHIDPTAMVTFMQTLEKQDAGAPAFAAYLSNHPRTTDRVAQLAKLASRSSSGMSTEPLLDSSTWAHARTACAEKQSSQTK